MRNADAREFLYIMIPRCPEKKTSMAKAMRTLAMPTMPTMRQNKGPRNELINLRSAWVKNLLKNVAPFFVFISCFLKGHSLEKVFANIFIIFAAKH